MHHLWGIKVEMGLSIFKQFSKFFTMPKKPTLDYFLFLRALACILVIRQHLDFPKFSKLQFLWIGHENSGGLAVAAFLVLSGYLTTKVLITKYKLSFKGVLNFYVGRFTRIAPLYYLVTAFTLFFIFPYLIQGIITNNDYQKYLFKLSTFTYITGLPYWNQVYWAISLEMFFYLFSPIFALLINQISKLSLKLALICGFLSIFFVILVPSKNFQSLFVSEAINFVGVFIFGGSLYLFHNFFNSVITTYSKNKLLNIFKLRYLPLFLFYLALTLPWFDIWTNFHLIHLSGNSNVFLGKYFEPIGASRFGIIMTSFLVGIGILITEITGGSSLKTEIIEQNDFQNKILSRMITIINYIGAVSFGIYLTHMLFVFRINDTFRGLFLEAFKSEIVAVYLSFFMACFLSIITSSFLFLKFEIPVKIWLQKKYNQIFININ
jgi:peptidoglycan/LPS O-acetylase OafA/YrhL